MSGRKLLDTTTYSLLDSAPDGGRVIRPKRVEQEKTLKNKILFVRICASRWFFYSLELL